MIESYRSVILLQFNNEVIASSVIFKFPNKLLPTDIQGLTHEKARPLKAYFVMLQWVIKEALNEKFDFVEFGPTTPGPKMDLGCTQVPLQAAGYCGNPIIAFGIKKCGAMVDTVHMKTENQNPNTSEEVTFEEENVEVQVNSLKTKTPGSVASVLVRQVPPTGSYVTQTQHSSENNPSAAVISQLTNVSRSIHDNSHNAEVLKDAIEISKKQVLRLSEKQKPANDRKTPRFSNTDRSDQYPCNKHNFTKTKNSTPRTNQENNLSTGNEAVFDELESHNPVNPIQTLSMSSNSNADEVTLSLSRPKNLKQSKKKNHTNANNNELMAKYLPKAQKYQKRLQLQAETDTSKNERENSSTDIVIYSSSSSFSLSATNPNTDAPELDLTTNNYAHATIDEETV
ncbi:unnamed protein product [Rotaria magnacalcarata]|nr:unnamed protein product [Rotaria magnacalcarata]